MSSITLRIEKRPGTARCYKSGSPDIFAVCHHCGRPMAEPHTPTHSSQDPQSQVLEFSGLDLASRQVSEFAIHCDSCNHEVSKGGHWVGWGVLLIVAGLPLLLVGIGILLLIIGIVLLVIGLKNRAAAERARVENRPPLPVISDGASVSVTERLKGRITLNSNSEYSGEVQSQTGEFVLKLHYDPEAESKRLKQYRIKYGLAEAVAIKVHFGFVQLQGAVSARFEGKEGIHPGRVNIFSIERAATDCAFLTGAAASVQRPLVEYHQQYAIPPSKGASSFTRLPIIVLPTMITDESSRTLEIAVHFREHWWSRLGRLIELEELRLSIPNAMGHVIATDPSSVIGDECNNCKSVTWRGVPPSAGAKRDRKEEGDKRGEGEEPAESGADRDAHADHSLDPLTFRLQFQEKIKRVPDAVIRGAVRLRFDDTLSGITGIGFFNALGSRYDQKKGSRDRIQAQVNTFVEADFDLNLAGLVLLRPVRKTWQKEHLRIVPDYMTVTKLIDLMTCGQISVKRLVESVPQVSKVGSHIVNRHWDITAVRYMGKGLWPIDYHVSVGGQQYVGSDAKNEGGHTNLDVTARAVCKGDDDDEGRDMEKHVENVGTLFDGFAVGLVDSLPAADDVVNVSASDQDRPEVGLAQQAASRKDIVRQAAEALVQGRITSEQYEEIKSMFS